MARYVHGKFTAADINLVDNVALVAGQFNKIGSYTVKAGEVIFLGWENYRDMESAVGRAYAKLQDNVPAEIKGEWMATIESPQDLPLTVLGNWRSEDMNTDATNKTLQIPFAKMNIGASKDKKIVFYFKPDTAKTITKANCIVNLDITRVLLDVN